MSEIAVQSGSAYDVLSLVKGQASKYADEKALAQVTKAGDYLPYLQVMGSSSNECKAGDFPVGEWALCKSRNKTPLGKSIVAMILSWRPKAMQYLPSVQNYYNPNSEVFQKIEAESMQPRSNKGFGPEFLLWLPEHGELVTYFMGNPTGRVEAPNLIAAFDKGQLNCRLAVELIIDKKKGNSWHGSRYYPYDMEITQLPPNERLTTVLEKFRNPPETEAEPSEKDEGGGDDRG